MMVLLIGLDVGTQGTKAVLYDDQEKAVIGRASVSYDLIPSDVPGRAEQDPEIWFSACQEALQTLLDEGNRDLVKGMGISGQQHGLVAMDGDGMVVRPAKLWCDVESRDEAEMLSSKLGYVMVPSLTLPKILWLKNNEPENYKKMETVLLPHDYINFKLTGRMCMECGDASGTGAFDIDKRVFDPEILKLVDDELATKFPPIIASDASVGQLTEEAASLLGLSSHVNVSPGSGDNMMSALGSGAVSDGILVLSLGTSGTLFGCSSNPIFDATGAVCSFCDATGRWLPLVCTMSCTGIVEEVKACFGLSHEELTELGEHEPIGCNGVNLLPYLNGERTPNWPNATAVLAGLSPGTLRPGLLYRAALEGATFTLLCGLKWMETLGLTSKELRVVGGGSKNRLWRRVIADAFQMPLRFPTEPESAALGAALQSGAVFNGIPVAEYVLSQDVPMSEDTVHPDPTVQDKYKEAYDRHFELGNKLFNS